MEPRARVRAFTTSKKIRDDLKRLRVSREGVDIMAPKALFYVVKLKGIEATPASILKQEMLVRRGEAAVSETAYYLEDDSRTDILLMGTVAQYRYLGRKLKKQPYKLKEIADEVKEVVKHQQESPGWVDVGGRRLGLKNRVRVIGTLNVTPDSFYDEGKYFAQPAAVERGLEMAREGADIIEVGGESARPGKSVPVPEEIRRVVPVIEILAEKTKVPISVDTYKPGVARAALEAGATIINDISGFEDPKMIELAADKQASCIVMHIKGRPKEAQPDPRYTSVMDDVVVFLRERVRLLLEAGLDHRKIMVDPGIGFSKNTRQNLVVMSRFSELRCLGFGIVAAVSHKFFIGEVLDLPVKERLEGTAAAVAWAILQGASLIRVHDIGFMKPVAKMAARLRPH